MVNRESSWCQSFHGFATELHDWLRSLTNSREYSYGVCTNKHDSATVALRIRPRSITTTIHHECFKQFKTSVALPWSFPNHHDSSRFTTIRHGSTTNHHGTPRYTTILHIVANRSGTVAKNRECVNGALGERSQAARTIGPLICYSFTCHYSWKCLAVT